MVPMRDVADPAAPPDGNRAPWREADRLAALRRYGILDTDASFDDFAKIAAQICDAPVAVVNFIDEHRQWFAAEIGLGVRETPLDVSICAHAILQPGVFVVPDLTQDRRFDRNPLVTGQPRLRFYGGAILETAAGLPLGTMCVLDYKARPEGLTDHQAFALEALARQIMAQLEMRILVAEKDLLVREAHHRVSNSLQMVQSLLTLQAGKAPDDDAAFLLHDSARRVQAFAEMHKHLYKAGAGIDVGLATYLGRIIEAQNESLGSAPGARRVVLSADAARWPAADAQAIGLIVLELVANALKHGQGEVGVSVAAIGGELELAVQDEGTDLPADYDPAGGTGLGMVIVNGLVTARGGQVVVDRSRPQTRFVARIDATTVA
jgi:two-component sensor histidine kinase